MLVCSCANVLTCSRGAHIFFFCMKFKEEKKIRRARSCKVWLQGMECCEEAQDKLCSTVLDPIFL